MNPNNLATLDPDVLEVELDELDNNLTKVKQQLTKVEAEYKETGITCDADWYSRAKTAAHIMAKKRQKLVVLISRVRKSQKQVEHQNNENSELKLFKQVLKRRISDELYREIIEEVESLRNDQNNPV